jgi:superfamily II DNA helicase RecQ
MGVWARTLKMAALQSMAVKRVRMAAMTVPAAMASLRIAAFRGRQEEAIQAILAGNDVLYVFPTGMG